MDRNFHTDDFERLLREKSDEFRMYPSKRIWHSIYNNIHPGHKWPSVAMCITLISALLLVGYLNTRNTNAFTGIKKNNTNNQAVVFSQLKSIQTDAPILIADVISSSFPEVKIISDKNNKIKSSVTGSHFTSAKSTLTLSLSYSPQTSPTLSSFSSSNIAGNNYLPTIDLHDNKADRESDLNNTSPYSQLDINFDSLEALKNINVTDVESVKIAHQFAAIADELKEADQVNNGVVTDFIRNFTQELNNPNPGNSAGIKVEQIISQTKLIKLTTNRNTIVGTDEKNWIDNYAFYNRPVPKKWANKLDWQIYATPAIVYRTLNNNSAFGNTLNATPFAISPASENINSSVIQTPSLGFELGTGLSYLILKNVRIKGGLQLNYTRYNAHAFENSHPVATKLTMHNFETKTSYEVYRSTAYSNNSGLESATLHNETLQVSLPVGVDVKLIGNERIQWNVGATLQPTFVAGGKSYLISSDRHNYVKETSMLNRWNLNAGFETFLSFKASGLTWQIGPQFRRQLFSTNNKTFAVQEKLVTYGIKFGVSKTLR